MALSSLCRHCLSSLSQRQVEVHAGVVGALAVGGHLWRTAGPRNPCDHGEGTGMADASGDSAYRNVARRSCDECIGALHSTEVRCLSLTEPIRRSVESGGGVRVEHSNGICPHCVCEFGLGFWCLQVMFICRCTRSPTRTKKRSASIRVSCAHTGSASRKAVSVFLQRMWFEGMRACLVDKCEDVTAVGLGFSWFIIFGTYALGFWYVSLFFFFLFSFVLLFKQRILSV